MNFAGFLATCQGWFGAEFFSMTWMGVVVVNREIAHSDNPRQ